MQFYDKIYMNIKYIYKFFWLCNILVQYSAQGPGFNSYCES